MKKRISVLGCIALVALAVTLTFQLTFHFVGTRYQEKLDNLSSSGSDFSRLSEVEGLVREHYIDTPDEDDLEDGALRGYVAGLGDPYSRYLSAAEYDAYKQSLSGAASGIGIRATQDAVSGQVIVYGVVSGSPAEEAGIRKGDVLYRVDDVSVSELGFYDAMHALSGELGTKVKVSFLREVAAKQMELSFTFTRAEFKVNSVSAEMLGETVGYIQIFSFDLMTNEEFRTAVEALIADGAKSLLIDVRNNAGGSLDAASSILDLILPRTDMYYRSDGSGKEKVVGSDEHCIKLPMAVLINESTASAAELFAAVLQSQGAATLVGTTTYGKGTGQRVLELEDGSALIISVERFRPVNRESFDGKGITPDLDIKLDGDNFYLLSRAKDNQLQEAINVIKAKEQS